ncbi:MAG TPA: hypothetical protein VIP51_00880 [Eoetvoesiella sp.]
MNPSSHLIQTLPGGVVLDVTIEDLNFKAYVVISEPDINNVAEFVPKQQFEEDGDLHVTAVSQADEAREQIEDLTFNMNLNDVAVFLCGNEQAYNATLEELGQP